MRQWHDISANRRSLAYLLFSAIVLAVMWAVTAGPARRQIAEARINQDKLKAKIEEQKILQPLYRKLQKLQKNNPGFTQKLPVKSTEKEPADISQATGHLGFLAEKAGIEVMGLFPSMDFIEDGTGQILIEARLSGAFINLRQFLIDMTSWAGYGGINSLMIKSSSPEPEYVLKIWISLS
jgi:Tfp pilus assembly protein PilO